MTFTARDLQKLRWHLIAALASLAAAGLLTWSSHQIELRAERDLQQMNQRAQTAEKQLQQIHREEEEIRSKAALFVQLKQAGIIGPERRLDWTEQLAAEQRRLRLPSLEYEIAPQAPLDVAGNGSYSYYKSAMKLRLQLLHEEDLLRFIAGLEKSASALVVTRRCKVDRLPDNARPGTFAQINAECELDWITARKSGST